MSRDPAVSAGCVLAGLAMVLLALPTGAAPRLDDRPAASVERLAPRGVRLSPPVLTRSRDGLTLRGRICGGGATLPPNRIRAERVGATGEVTAVSARSLPNLAYRGQPCAIYGLAPRWTLEAGDRLRLCATRGPGPCAP